MRCSLLSVKQLNYHDNTDQGQFLVGRRNFTVLYNNPKRGDCQITQIIKPIQSSERSLNLKWGILSVFANFSKQSPLRSPFRILRIVLFNSEFCIYEWNAVRNFYITNKCSTMCVCLSVCWSGLRDLKAYSLLGGGVPIPEQRLRQSLDSVPLF